MEKGEKVRQLIGEKLKRGVSIGKREGNSTPSPTWNFGFVQPDGTLLPDFHLSSTSNCLSARKLGANLWEMLPESNPSLAKLRKIRLHQKGENTESKELGGEHDEQPASGVDLGEAAAASPTQHNLRVKKAVQAQQPASPASYRSSMEMPPYRPAIAPNDSVLAKGKLGESSPSLRTSTELLKVLNRIWSLEEKHALDMSIVKMLRRELDQSQEQIQELLQEKKTDQTEINNLTKRLSEYEVAMKKEREGKIEDEHKLRRNSDRFTRKSGNELLDLKSLLSNTLKELERERKARTLLEDLCDEFAKGIGDYEQELRSMKHKYCEDQTKRDGDSRLILHISEAWLDQRSQMKLSEPHVFEKSSDLDKLCFEIEGFLQAKQSGKNNSIPVKNCFELFRLNEPASAPWKAIEEDDSVERSAISKVGKKKVQTLKDLDASTSLMQQKSPYTYSNSRKSREGETMHRPLREGKNRMFDTNGDDLHNTAASRQVKNLEGSINSSMFTGPSSPVKKWISDTYDSSTALRWPGSIKSGSLKTKLMEARVEGLKSRPMGSPSPSS
ncbi:uncharacterized protein At5g41620-like [Andrographis paniculata]|uniref:uncharacterized protein At5g41620-like n=1 Tax=Andrographis paniculata TaxID=175694 RepID=UPI0021E6DF4C|nr:uncharacterized protein At5g41620-like [Andrographis paniculata]XP_051146368.1 uncharacterized protein At5g41620-like [Andrographis paniculata]XP_051146373.1 uncharacterized protein At5g41620-like [Andrographis paniculata]